MRKAEDYDTTGRWKVITCRVKDMVEEEEKVSAEFDGVMLCQGFYSVPYTPAVPGLTDAFQGQVHHVSTYRRPAPFAGRTVLVVGEQMLMIVIMIIVISLLVMIMMIMIIVVVSTKAATRMMMRRRIMMTDNEGTNNGGSEEMEMQVGR